ncbi:MAG: hypothetical protein HZB17_09005 [Chloroflexi bacterium]|nr:hypothetical protein [Chloroflexota bacterium]MBI5081423.1 hypothetical protein [Chloroflexota bacterium]
MLNTYRAILDGNQLKWIDAPPQTTKSMEVQVIMLKETTQAALRERGRKMALALESLAKINPISDINDPLQWQRDIRQDRPLPNR